MKKIIAIACMAWIALAGAWADNISAEDITLQKGETKTVNISLTNTESYIVSFQIDLTLPEGISINKAGCSLSNRISDPDQELAIGKQGDNVYRIASTSFALTPISGTSGTLLTLSLTASANSEGGTASLSNIRFITSNSERVTISEASFNIDFTITFADANVKALCVQNWDTDGDGELSEAEAAAVTDLGVVYKLNATITSFDELQYFTGLTNIGNSAFLGCTGLTSITIPNSVTSIGKRAFMLCRALTSITIPNSVTSIGNYAFYQCSSLTSVTVEMETPLTIESYTFSNRANATLYVPAGCKAAYEAADYWKEFKEIVEASIEPTDISQLDNAIYVEPVETARNCTYALNIKAKNNVTIAGMGFTLTVPEGFYLDNEGDGIFNKLDSQRAISSKFMVMTSQNGNAYTFNVMPTSTTAISGNDGTVLTVRLKNENAELGIHELKISDAIYSVRNDDNSYETLDVADVISTIDISDEMLGDVNGDNRMDLTDAIMIVNHSLNNTPSNFKMKVADVNGDGNIDLTDAIIVVNRSMGNSSHARQAFFMDFDPE